MKQDIDGDESKEDEINYLVLDCGHELFYPCKPGNRLA
jgi:hypothetical protein